MILGSLAAASSYPINRVELFVLKIVSLLLFIEHNG